MSLNISKSNTPSVQNRPHRRSAAVTLALLSPVLLISLSGCSSNCDSNGSTPQTSDDCGVSSSGGYHGGSYVGRGYSGGSYGGSEGGSARGGFGSFGGGFGEAGG